MKKGLPRIIIGCILIIIQLLSVIGNSLTGNHLGISFTNVYVFIYDLLGLLTYYFLGILGVVLLISGLVVYNRKDKVPREKSKNAPRSFFDDTTSISNGQETAEARAAHNPVQHSNQEELHTNTAIKHGKHKYCSRCGSPIDSISKKCTGCGMQYFKGIRVSPAYILFTLIVLALVFALLSSLSKIAVMKQEINNKNTTISELSLDIQKMKEEINTQYEEGKTIGYDEGYSKGFAEGSIKATDQDPSIICSHTYMVFHNMDCYCGKVHHLHCKYNTNDEQYLYLTLPEALQLGYKPCEECY